MGRQPCVSLALFKVLLRLLTKHPIVQFDFNLLFLFLPNPPGDGQIDWPIKIMMVKISLKNSAHITMFTEMPRTGDWLTKHLSPEHFFFLFFLSKQAGISQNLKDLPVLLCEIRLTVSVYPMSLAGSNNMKGCVWNMKSNAVSISG